MIKKPQASNNAKNRLRVPAAMLVRDAISLMNEHSLNVATVIDSSGRTISSLEQRTIIQALDRDSDELLKTTCEVLCREQLVAQAA